MQMKNLTIANEKKLNSTMSQSKLTYQKLLKV